MVALGIMEVILGTSMIFFQHQNLFPHRLDHSTPVFLHEKWRVDFSKIYARSRHSSLGWADICSILIQQAQPEPVFILSNWPVFIPACGGVRNEHDAAALSSKTSWLRIQQGLFFQNILLLIIGGWVFNGYPAQHCILSYGYGQSHLTNYWLQSKCKMFCGF